jgi:Ni,Fe-hydrogenase III small subunit/formate hydrogenlyase subunit 6/NADH:ubiquinone oxidoreductase subunit I
MIRILRARLRQGYRTTRFPRGPAPSLPGRFRGLPVVDTRRCAVAGACARCAESCPVGAIDVDSAAAPGGGVRIDLGRCLFCTDCERSCPAGAIRMGEDYRLATRARADLLWHSGGEPLRLADALSGEARRLFGRSLRFREVSAGGCNACEADSNVLTTVGWDMGRFGIQYVASPRHADALWVTGPVSANMRLALQKTWEALPAPRLVVAVGACAISGGPFRDLPEVANGVTDILPVDLHVPGCPPHPLTILDGLLRLLGRIR